MKMNIHNKPIHSKEKRYNSKRGVFFVAKKNFRLLLAFVFASVSNLWAQTDGKYFPPADTLNRYQQIWLASNWKCHAGDDSAWSAPNFDDRAWETADTWLAPQKLSASD
jgi:hypothetical protein